MDKWLDPGMRCHDIVNAGKYGNVIHGNKDKLRS
jgi:hypothetical protein